MLNVEEEITGPLVLVAEGLKAIRTPFVPNLDVRAILSVPMTRLAFKKTAKILASLKLAV
jgi:hypothetical protein